MINEEHRGTGVAWMTMGSVRCLNRPHSPAQGSRGREILKAHLPQALGMRSSPGIRRRGVIERDWSATFTSRASRRDAHRRPIGDAQSLTNESTRVPLGDFTWTTKCPGDAVYAWAGPMVDCTVPGWHMMFELSRLPWVSLVRFNRTM